MKPWRGWALIDVDGRLDLDCLASSHDAFSGLLEGERIARVEVREVAPKKRLIA